MIRYTKFMAFVYFGLGALFIFLAISYVNNQSWTLWTFLFAGIAAFDILMGVRFLRTGAGSNSSK